MDPYQTIIFHRQSGEILDVLPNKYIASKNHFKRLTGLQDPSTHRFIYFKSDMPIDPSFHKVQQLTNRTPPKVTGKDGQPIEFQATMHARRNLLQSGKYCLVEFEGGAGDQLMEAQAILQAIAQYPNSQFAIRAQQPYIPILTTIPELPLAASGYVGKDARDFSLTVSNHTDYISDPRGGNHGKASLYGAWLGLDHVTTPATPQLNRSDFSAIHPFLTKTIPNNGKPLFLCQFRSGSGHAKSWQSEHVIALAKAIHNQFAAPLLVLGAGHDLQGQWPHVLNLCGKTSWHEAFLLTALADCVICIDSGIMHFARALNTPHIVLWGGTPPKTILGTDKQPQDIRLDLDCINDICYDCPKKSNACMAKITPSMVMGKLNHYLKEGLSHGDKAQSWLRI